MIENLKALVPYNVTIGEPDNPDTHLVEIEEEWRDIPGFPYNRASSFGRVCSVDKWVRNPFCGTTLRKGQLLKPFTNPYGYQVLSAMPEGKNRYPVGVHRLVGLAFYPNPDNLPEINHLDYDRANNLVGNLEWCPISQNSKHKYLRFTQSCIKKNSKKIVLTDISTQEKLHFESLRRAAHHFGVEKAYIQRALKLKYKLFRKYIIELSHD